MPTTYSTELLCERTAFFDPVAIALEEEEIEVDQDADRDDIDEFEIMIDEEDSDVEESDSDSDVSDDVVEDVTDEVDEVENEVEIDYGGDAPYWFALREELTAILYNTHYTLYDEWRNACILATGLVQPLPPNPATVDEALSGPHADLWRAAITKELDQFRLRTTFGPAEQSGQGMKTKLILYYKYDGEYNLVCKARLVVCGYSQRKNVDYFDTYSPTTTVTTVFSRIYALSTSAQPSSKEELILVCSPGYLVTLIMRGFRNVLRFLATGTAASKLARFGTIYTIRLQLR